MQLFGHYLETASEPKQYLEAYDGGIQSFNLDYVSQQEDETGNFLDIGFDVDRQFLRNVNSSITICTFTYQNGNKFESDYIKLDTEPSLLKAKEWFLSKLDQVKRVASTKYGKQDFKEEIGTAYIRGIADLELNTRVRILEDDLWIETFSISNANIPSELKRMSMSPNGRLDRLSSASRSTVSSRSSTSSRLSGSSYPSSSSRLSGSSYPSSSSRLSSASSYPSSGSSRLSRLAPPEEEEEEYE
jgi:hypothetical protein